MPDPTVSTPPDAPEPSRVRTGAQTPTLARARENTLPPPDADDLVAAFLAGRRATTHRAYAGALSAFAAWCGASSVSDALRALLCGSAAEANRTIYRWRGELLARGLATATVGLRLSALRAVVRVARMHGMIGWQLDVPGVRREPYRDTRGPGRRGVRALLAATADGTTPKDARDRAIVRLLTDLALRRAEVCALDRGDLDLSAGTLAVLGKGKTLKTKLTMPAETAVALAAWVAVRGDVGDDGDDDGGPLFTGLSLGRARTRLTGTSLARIVRILGERAGISGLHPHALRHAAITEALDVTRGDIRAVQRFSRHADPRTLLLYDDARTDKAGEVASAIAAWR